MRTEQVISAFLRREKAHTPYREAPLNGLWAWRGASLTSTGEKLISYETPIAEWRGGKLAINNARYSNTTSKQQSLLRRECERLGVETEEF